MTSWIPARFWRAPVECSTDLTLSHSILARQRSHIVTAHIVMAETARVNRPMVSPAAAARGCSARAFKAVCDAPGAEGPPCFPKPNVQVQQPIDYLPFDQR